MSVYSVIWTTSEQGARTHTAASTPPKFGIFLCFTVWPSQHSPLSSSSSSLGDTNYVTAAFFLSGLTLPPGTFRPCRSSDPPPAPRWVCCHDQFCIFWRIMMHLVQQHGGQHFLNSWMCTSRRKNCRLAHTIISIHMCKTLLNPDLPPPPPISHPLAQSLDCQAKREELSINGSPPCSSLPPIDTRDAGMGEEIHRWGGQSPPKVSTLPIHQECVFIRTTYPSWKAWIGNAIGNKKAP